MEMCPNAPGYLDLMRSWLTGDRTDPMAWAAVYLTVIDIFLLALAIFTLGR